MKYIFLLLTFFTIISCEDEAPVDPFAISDKTRDSIYLKVQELYVAAKYEDAEKLLSTIRAKDIYDHNYYSHNARIKYNLHKYSEAIHFINNSLRVSNSASIYFVKACCYESLNLKDSSIIALNKAISLDSTNAGYIVSRIRYYLHEKLPSVALNDANRLLKIDSTNLQYQSYVGLCKYEFGDTLGSLNIYESILQKDANNLDALKSLGFIYLRQNNNAKAKLYFNKYLNDEPTNGEVFFGMASILSKENKIEKACDCLLKSIEYGYEEAFKHAYKCEDYFKKKGIQIQIRTDTISPQKESKSTEI